MAGQRKHLLMLWAQLLALAAVFSTGAFWGAPPASAAAPELVISGYKTVPAMLAPGQSFDLTLDLTNRGDRRATRVKVTLLDTGSAEVLPVIVQGTGNVRFIGNIGRDKRISLKMRLVTPPGLESGPYALRFRIDGMGARAFSTEQFIGVNVARVAKLEVISFTAPEKVQVGEEFQATAEVGNLSDFSLQGVAFSIESPGLDLSDHSLYVGTLEAGDSDVIEASATAEEPGEVAVQLSVRYQDDEGNRQVLRETVTASVEGEPEEEQEGRGFWASVGNFFRSLFGLGEAER